MSPSVLLVTVLSLLVFLSTTVTPSAALTAVQGISVAHVGAGYPLQNDYAGLSVYSSCIIQSYNGGWCDDCGVGYQTPTYWCITSTGSQVTVSGQPEGRVLDTHTQTFTLTSQTSCITKVDYWVNPNGNIDALRFTDSNNNPSGVFGTIGQDTDSGSTTNPGYCLSYYDYYIGNNYVVGLQFYWTPSSPWMTPRPISAYVAGITMGQTVDIAPLSDLSFLNGYSSCIATSVYGTWCNNCGLASIRTTYTCASSTGGRSSVTGRTYGNVDQYTANYNTPQFGCIQSIDYRYSSDTGNINAIRFVSSKGDTSAWLGTAADQSGSTSRPGYCVAYFDEFLDSNNNNIGLRVWWTSANGWTS